MKKCEYFKKSINKCKCKLTNSTITLLDCIKCTKFKQTSVKSINITHNNKSVLKRVKMPLNKVSKKREFVTKDTYNAVMLKCNSKCVLCGTAQNLQLHHIVYRSHDKSLINEVSNCVALCLSCHQLVHTSSKKYKPLLLEIEKNLTK